MQLTFPDCDILCLYDLPRGDELDVLKQWLEEDQARLAVIFSKRSEGVHPQVEVCGKDSAEIEKLAREKVFLRFGYLPLHEKDELFFSKVETIVEKVALNASDFQNRGVDHFDNLVKNSAYFERAFEGKELFGVFSHIPAIICGAGPSLEVEVERLRALSERALLFAGGAALPSLCSFGLKPHFGGLIDPHPPTQKDLNFSLFETPCFFQSRVHPKKLFSLQGPLLWTPGSEQDFFQDIFFEGGWNVSTYLAALACHLGCNPIILVGVDLCGRRGNVYVGKVECEQEMIEMADGLVTKKDWLFAVSFLASFVKAHPEVEWMNASNGLEIEGFINKRLSEISLDSEYDLRGMIHSAIAHCKQGVMKGFDPKELFASLERVSALCSQVLAHIEKIFPASVEKDSEYALLVIEIEREEAYSFFAKKVWEVWKPVLMRSIPKEMPRESALELNQWIFIKGICDDAKQV